MATVELTTRIDAPRNRVYDLKRSVPAHEATMADHDERAVGGVTDGLLTAGDRVTWRARHFGLPLELTVAVTQVDSPRYFRDELVEGPFAELVHDHRFEADGDRTVMHDEFSFRSPLGPVGRVVDAVYLTGYMRSLLVERNDRLRRLAEGDEWQAYCRPSR